MRRKIKKILKTTFTILILCVTILIGIILLANWRISSEAQKYIYHDIDSIPENSVALVLGTSQYIGSIENPYFTYRMEAAKELYKTGKIDAFVVSGDNKHRSYNEPRDMRQTLIKCGVPDSIINFDFAGFRTLDSVIRMRKVFGQKSYIIVSQQFHNERAIYIARYYDIEAYGYNAKDLPVGRFSYKTKIRELLARVKVFIDIATGKGPKFLGDPIEIGRACIQSLNEDSSLDTDSINSEQISCTPDSICPNAQDSISN